MAAEVALSFCLVLGALLLSSTMLSLVDQPLGFERDNVLTWKASLPLARYPGIAKQNDFYRRVLSELRRQPGVRVSGMTRYLPLDGEQSTWDFLVEGRPLEDAGERLDVALQPVSQDYFSAMGLRIVAGRGIRLGRPR